MLEEARRSIDRQSESVQRVRERAIGLVGFGSIVAAAFGFAGGTGRSVAGAVALAAFLVVVGTAGYVLIPREFHFELGANRIDAWIYKDPSTRDVNHIRRSTAQAHAENHRYNRTKLNRLQAAIAVGVGALAVETVALVARLVF